MEQNVDHVKARGIEAPHMVFQPASGIGQRIILMGWVKPDVAQSAQGIMAEIMRTVRDAIIVPKKSAVPCRMVRDKGDKHQKHGKEPVPMPRQVRVHRSIKTENRITIKAKAKMKNELQFW